MSASRRLQRQKTRSQSKQARKAEVVAAKVSAPVDARARQVATLRARVRLVLVTTSMAALLVVYLFREPVAAILQQYGLAARVAFILILLGPALFTWLVGFAQLRDATQSSS